MNRLNKQMKKTLMKTLATLVILIGVATFSPQSSEASPGFNIDDVSFRFTGFQSIEKRTKHITNVRFTSDNKTGRGGGIVHMKHTQGFTNITQPKTVGFVKSNKNYVEMTVKKSRHTGKILSTRTLVYLDKSNFQKAVVDYEKTFKQRPKIVMINEKRKS